MHLVRHRRRGCFFFAPVSSSLTWAAFCLYMGFSLWLGLLRNDHELGYQPPGIVCHQTGIIQEKIDFQDWMKMLTMHNPETNVDAGRWVQVCKGTYKGDVGYVLASEPWGVHLLLVPLSCCPILQAHLWRGNILLLLQNLHYLILIL